MKVTRRKEVVRRGKAALVLQRKLGWTRSEWISEVESVLGEAFILFAQARLADRNGGRREARASMAEFDRLLSRRVMQVHVHPVKRAFDRTEAFEEAVARMSEAIPALRGRVELEFGPASPRGLDDRDEEFWRRVREAAKVLTGYLS